MESLCFHMKMSLGTEKVDAVESAVFEVLPLARDRKPEWTQRRESY